MSEPAVADHDAKSKGPAPQAKPESSAPLPKNSGSPAKPALSKLRRALAELIATYRAANTQLVPIYAHHLRIALLGAIQLRNVATDAERVELADLEKRANVMLSRPNPTPAAPTKPDDSNDLRLDDLRLDWDYVSDAVDQIIPGVGPAIAKAPQVYRDAFESITRSPLHLSTVFKEKWEALKDHWPEFLATAAVLVVAELVVLALAASPEPVATKIAAAVLQGLIVAFAIQAVVSTSTQASSYAQAFWMNVEAADGDARMIDAAALNFARLIVALIEAIQVALGAGALIQRAATSHGLPRTSGEESGNPATSDKPTTPEKSPQPQQATKPKETSANPPTTSSDKPSKGQGTKGPVAVALEQRVERNQLTVEAGKTPNGWHFEVNAPLPNGRQHSVGHGGATLDAHGTPTGGPSFTIDKATFMNGAEVKVEIYQAGRKLSATDVVLDEAIAAFKKDFGHAPDTLPGRLAWENERNFRVEYAKAAARGMSHDDANQFAIRNISFGRSRAERGYDRFTVKTPDLVDIDLGQPLGVRRVPSSIYVEARRSK